MKSNMPNIFIQDYDYPLPDEKIALFPLINRDDSKLLVHKSGKTKHHIFKDLPEFLPQDGLLIFNNTKVIPARINLTKDSGPKIEVFLLKPIQGDLATQSILNQDSETIWECLVGNKKRWKANEQIKRSIYIDAEEIILTFHWHERNENLIKITWDEPIPFAEILDAVGQIPLPPYMGREVGPEDKNRYQTIFSKESGAVAAPTASLHFSQEVFIDLEKRGIKTSYLTLHVGAGTFLPVKEENVQNHPMHREQLIFSKEFIQNLQDHEGPYIPVGTTSMRAVESAVSSQRTLNTFDGWTNKFLFPPHDFSIANCMITNFHVPESTLLMMVCAFAGYDLAIKAYKEAVKEKYRFYSYGDAMLII